MAVGVFALIVNGEPEVSARVADDVFPTKAACDERQALVRERVTAPPPPGIVLAGLGQACVEVKVAQQGKKPVVREFTPQEQRGDKNFL